MLPRDGAAERSADSDTLARSRSANTDGGAWVTSSARGVRYNESFRSAGVSRVESANGVIARCHEGAHGGVPPPAIELAPGAWLVLSAHTEGEPAQYPRLSLRPVEVTAARTKPVSAVSPTPVTARAKFATSFCSRA